MFYSLKKYTCLLFILSCTITSYTQEAASFIHISDELVNNEVTSIIQDHKGFKWFGTRGGLHRFDGYEMKLLKNDINQANNLLSQSIEVLQNGKNNIVWVGTKSGGLSSYDLTTGRIINYINTNPGNTGFNADYILSLLDTDTEKLLIGTWKGFQYLDKKTEKFTVLSNTWKTFDIQPDGDNGFWLATNSGLRHLDNTLKNDQVYDFGIPGINITAIVHDKDNNCLWLGTWNNGLIKFNLYSNSFKQFFYQPNKKGSISSNNTYRLLLDKKGTLWIGTWGGGLNRFNRKTETADKMDLTIPGIFTTDNQIILTIQEDPSGLLWVGTDGAGVFKMDLNPKKFFGIGYKSDLLGGNTHVLSVYVDPFKKLWLSTKGGGIQYSSDNKVFHKLLIKGPRFLAAGDNPFECRAFIQEGDNLWLGTNKGLIRLKNKESVPGKYEIFTTDTADINSISGRKINALVKDSSGRIWVGTQENGLCYISGYDRYNKPLFKKYFPAYGKKGALQNERVSCMLVDSKKRLWIGTYKGLHLYNPVRDDFIFFIKTGDLNYSISDNTILCLAEDKSGNIWAGTQYGISQITGMEGDKLKVTVYTTKEGLPNDYIHALIPDSRNNIWASTNKGIVRLSIKDKSLAVFDKRDGVQSNMFSENASCKDASGQFYFGGVEGLTYYNPDDITISQFSPQVYFTNLRVNNKPYEFGQQKNDSILLDRPFYETRSITLTHRDNILDIEFAALDYRAPDKNEYMYMLGGFNKDWVYAGNNRLVSFTNLKPGTYRLKVMATNSDKIWNNTPHELQIKILPPFWKTWWAYLFYFILFAFLLWLTRYFGLKQAELKNQLALTRLARKQENQLSDFKERLFTNISHEFRTPLTLILGPVDDLLYQKKIDTVIKKNLRLVQKQSKRMLRMVNQLLDYQKAETGSLKLTKQPGEIISFCREVFNSFRDDAERKKINYTFNSSDKYFSFVFDHNKLEIILFNVLANAFKFTAEGGSINLTINKTNDKSCEIVISDTGKGIQPDELSKIFDRFYRGKGNDAASISGTGIGLSFVKELTELHGGSITAESDGIKGSAFRIQLPHTENGEANYSSVYDRVQLNDYDQEHTVKLLTMENENLPQEPEQSIILVVEDDIDIQHYIAEILSPSFKVITASNGKEGIEKALEIIPDVIVSDIMMPEIDGIELCKKLKSDKDTSHIPIILLTALTDMNHHVQGIREGADVYLPKPFNSQLLLVHIHNLISTRNKLKELYARKVFLGSGNFEIKSFEEEFLNKVMKIVEDNIPNSQFSSDELAGLMYMSRSTFYRKLKAVTGMSGNEFIRTARLNYAAKLLESGRYSVTDVAYEAGFNDIKYFRKRFQDRFGASPSEYKKS